MKISKIVLSALLAIGAVGSAFASPTYTYVGQWAVDSGPNWNAQDQNGKYTTLIYSGVEAAAAIFGGTASDYVTSTVGTDVASIDFQAWFDGYGQSATIFADTLHADPANSGLYAIPKYDQFAPTWSAWVADHGNTNINYAFRVTDASNVPEPASLALVGLGLAGIVATRKRKQA